MQINALMVAACLLNVRVVYHLENVLIAHGKNVAASIGFSCNARVRKTLGLKNPRVSDWLVS
jgi:hypothetical protein